MGLLLAVLLARLWWLQLTNWYQYSSRALDNRTTVVYKPAPRGLIYDRRGEYILAENCDVWSLHAVPGELPRDEQELERIVQFLAGVLSTEDAPTSTAEVRHALADARLAKAVEPVPLGTLGQDLTFDQVASIEEHRIELPGIVVVTTTRRHYPYGRLAAQAVGYARQISREQLDRLSGYQQPPDPDDPTASELEATATDPVYRPDSIIGAEGAEALLELDTNGDRTLPILPGRAGRTIYEVDANGNPQRLIATREPEIGAQVYLTIDARAQAVAERQLRKALQGHPERMGAAVVLDTRNGDVIVLASEPCLDPNDWVFGLTGDQWKQALEDPGLPLLNKALAGTYPPGSIFKVVSVCAALETTNVKPTSTAVCTGAIHVGRKRRPFVCWMADRGGHGPVDLVSAIAKSCNIWFYNCVLKFGLDPNDIALYAHRFGLGSPTGLGLKGELSGDVPEPRYGERPWTQGNSLNYVIGQELTVTPAQMARVCAAVANGGKLPRPHLVRRIRWPARMNLPPTKPAGVLEKVKLEHENTLQIVRLGMRRAVTMEHGTAKLLNDLSQLGGKINNPGPSVFGEPLGRPLLVGGKTGTAQHDRRKENHSWCIAFAPYDARPDEPQYAVCVFVAQAGSGSGTAVPIAREVLRALFGLYEADDPDFAVPRPMDPAEVAAQRKQRVAQAKAWAARRAADAAEQPQAGDDD